MLRAAQVLRLTLVVPKTEDEQVQAAVLAVTKRLATAKMKKS